MTDPPGAKLKSAVDRAAACIVGIRASSLGLRSVLVTRVGGAGRGLPTRPQSAGQRPMWPGGRGRVGKDPATGPASPMIEDEPK